MVDLESRDQAIEIRSSECVRRRWTGHTGRLRAPRVARRGLAVARQFGPRADRSRCAEHRGVVGRLRRMPMGWFCGSSSAGDGTDPCRTVDRICRQRRPLHSAHTRAFVRLDWRDIGSRSCPYWLNAGRTMRSNCRCAQMQRLKCQKCDGAGGPARRTLARCMAGRVREKLSVHLWIGFGCTGARGAVERGAERVGGGDQVKVSPGRHGPTSRSRKCWATSDQIRT